METTGNTQQFLKKLKPGPPSDPAIPRLGIDPKELKAGSQTDTGRPKFTAARMRKRPEGPQPGVDKQTPSLPTREYCSASSRKGARTQATSRTDPEDRRLGEPAGESAGEISRSQKDKCCAIRLHEALRSQGPRDREQTARAGAGAGEGE